MAELVKATSFRQLKAKAKVSAATITRVRAHDRSIPDHILLRMAGAARQLLAESDAEAKKAAEGLAWLIERAASEGVNALAAQLSCDPSNLSKVIARQRKPSPEMIRMIENQRRRG